MSYLWLLLRSEHDVEVVIMAVLARLIAVKTLTL